MGEVFDEGNILHAGLHAPGGVCAAVVDGGGKQPVGVKVDAGGIERAADFRQRATFLGVGVIAGGIPALYKGSGEAGLHFRAQSRVPALLLTPAVGVVAAVDEVRSEPEGIKDGQLAADARPVVMRGGIKVLHFSLFIHVNDGIADRIAPHKTDHAPRGNLEAVGSHVNAQVGEILSIVSLIRFTPLTESGISPHPAQIDGNHVVDRSGHHHAVDHIVKNGRVEGIGGHRHFLTAHAHQNIGGRNDPVQIGQTRGHFFAGSGYAVATPTVVTGRVFP